MCLQCTWPASFLLRCVHNACGVHPGWAAPWWFAFRMYKFFSQMKVDRCWV
jgi:hypothetical protein